MTDFDGLMTPDEMAAIGINKMQPAALKALESWGLQMYNAGKRSCDEIAEIKFSGQLVKLTDGSALEVDDLDSSTADRWAPGDRVLVVGTEMFNLDDFEKVDLVQN